MLFNAFCTALLLATVSSSVSAAPMNAPQELIVFNPPITSPKEFSAWAKGSEQIVRWDIKGIPVQRVNTTGLVLLGHMENNSENLDIEHPLASGFPINSGSVKVTMPKNAATRSDYFVVLFGDSGNKSPKFKIH
ncbi:hypothetical protein M413DRAFT_32141 [Hebeloma cylindrosporum]|uniref:Uncharacterized protein n=1 Tax=Hebeloma cylindrosporum TaxID=76867 RepID=A0A0C3BV04_HEBCY|nr:hypothetical protein M413DRAFT_32141 [Hebeloma cylindrosporum h7]